MSRFFSIAIIVTACLATPILSYAAENSPVLTGPQSRALDIAQTEKELEKQAVSFVENYFAHISSPSADRWVYISTVYAGQVDWYGEIISREEVTRRVMSATEQWPVEHYTFSAGSPLAHCDLGSATCIVSGGAHWSFENPKTAATQSMDGDISFIVFVTNGHMLIVARSVQMRSQKAVPLAASSQTPVVQLTGLSCYFNAGYINVQGQVKNVTDYPVDDLEAIAVFKTGTGTFVDSSSALVEYQPLLPGQTSPFKVLKTINPAIDSAELDFKLFSGETVKSSGGHIAKCSQLGSMNSSQAQTISPLPPASAPKHAEMPATLRQCYYQNKVDPDDPCLTGDTPTTQEQHAARARCMLQESIRRNHSAGVGVLALQADSGSAEMTESAASYCELGTINR